MVIAYDIKWNINIKDVLDLFWSISSTERLFWLGILSVEQREEFLKMTRQRQEDFICQVFSSDEYRRQFIDLPYVLTIPDNINKNDIEAIRVWINKGYSNSCEDFKIMEA